MGKVVEKIKLINIFEPEKEIELEAITRDADGGDFNGHVTSWRVCDSWRLLRFSRFIQTLTSFAYSRNVSGNYTRVRCNNWRRIK